MSRTLKAFGENVRKIRLAKGWSQEDLAAACKLHRTYVSGIEQGERNVSLTNITKIAAALQVSPGKLFENTEP